MKIQLIGALQHSLKPKGFRITSHLNGKERGIDVAGEKGVWKVNVESKGSLGMHHHGTDKVFDSNQIFDHLCKQVVQLMQLRNDNKPNTIYVMPNPDIQRIRGRVSRVINTLDEVSFVRFWVQENEEVLVDHPLQMEELLKSLGLIN
jgi:hypothetical protein